MGLDVIQTLEDKIQKLQNGPHVAGLKAVKLHLDAAERHLKRGQAEADDSSFTDVIFRCNQAFEGSVKEAYRVLTDKDPQKKTPAEIEKYLADGDLLRKRVLDQFTRYRQEWRNPSTHDYTLDFDEDEALLAIVTVSVFAIVLCDQIEGKLAYDEAAAAQSSTVVDEPSLPLLELVSQLVHTFAKDHLDAGLARGSVHLRYPRIEGSLAGFLSAELAKFPDISVTPNKRIGRLEVDVLIERETEKVVIELKHSAAERGYSRSIIERALNQVTRYIHELKASGAVILEYSPMAPMYEVEPGPGELRDIVRIVAPYLMISD
ncbi:hypothetical protein [Rhizobium laguerreae]|uniref:hypothetical protein n=1 Tax=Rhizobium laguerreae TaxID=1076926 RepID=UPI001C91DF6D|nr:hypothetical protein [Rhizobium laguerreae]MBY3489431.1 HEPN domain-containing protein [Rhizobium laguerreae]